MFAGISEPMATNWINPQVHQIIKRKRVYLDSVAEIAPYSVVHDAADAVAHELRPDGHNDATAISKMPTTHGVKYCTMIISPNMVIRQLFPSVDEEGGETENSDMIVNDPNTRGQYSFDALKPTDNIWCVLTSSDEGDGALSDEHRTTFRVKRTSVFRDHLDNRSRVTH